MGKSKLIALWAHAFISSDMIYFHFNSEEKRNLNQPHGNSSNSLLYNVRNKACRLLPRTASSNELGTLMHLIVT